MVLILVLSLCACNPTEEKKDTDCVDVFIFMGQSNMAGRGIQYEESIPCAEGHGYEYRAVSGNDTDGWLYPVKEPFGKTEGNEQMEDVGGSGDKKSGSMVSSFCENYYETCGVPIVAISASVGGTSIQLWGEGTTFFKESRRRLDSCLDYLQSVGTRVRHINMVWCQGETDGQLIPQGFDYAAALKDMFTAFRGTKEGRIVENCFIVTPSEYSSGKINENKVAISNIQINMCETENNFVLASVKFRNVPLELRDDPHFYQGVYNVVGWDAGARAAQYLTDGTVSKCEEFVPGEEMELALKFNILLTHYAQNV